MLEIQDNMNEEKVKKMLKNPELGEWIPVKQPCFLENYGKLMQKKYLENCEGSIFRTADLIIDLKEATVQRGNTKIHLRMTERNLLEAFMMSPETTVPRDTLLEILQLCAKRSVMDNTLSVQIGRLRRHLKSLQGNQYIQTHNSVGYVWKYPVFRQSRP